MRGNFPYAREDPCASNKLSHVRPRRLACRAK